VGLADGFPRPDEQVNDDGEIEVISIEDLPASERFFAGGDTTIRGFALDTVGAGNTISPQGFPRGGNAVLIMNGELRVPVTTNLGAALFLDGGNVYERITDFGLRRSCAAATASACATARRSARSASTWASRSRRGRTSRAARSTSASGRRSKPRITRNAD
jgi:outer membrane protein assembly factor BamA